MIKSGLLCYRKEKYTFIWLFLSGALLFFFITGYITYSSNVLVKKDTELLSNTHNVIVSIDGLALLLKDLESSLLDYITTEKQEHFVSYNMTLYQIQQQLDRLEKLTMDNPKQQENMPIIRKLINVKLEDLEKSIRIRKQKGYEQAYEIVSADEIKATEDELRIKLLEVRQIETNLRTHRYEEMHNSHTLALATGVVSCVLGLLLSFSIAILLHRSTTLRSREEWLQTGHSGLNQAVLGDLKLEQLAQNILKFFCRVFGCTGRRILCA